ncbi:MAG: hypothetical protein HS122_01295 [Opitutaceae bacterium]|nr:hypothetical protein [Opitutaceae bacterium]
MNSALPRQSAPRLAALDICKGVLVLTMVFYHSLNYSSQYHLAFRYMSFLPPSFIFITGYLVIALYPARYGENKARMHIRLISRGVRLILIFTLLNLGGLALAKRMNPLDVLAVMGANASDIFLIGSGRSAIFEVLLPIGYFLCFRRSCSLCMPEPLAPARLCGGGRWGDCSPESSRPFSGEPQSLMAGMIGAATGRLSASGGSHGPSRQSHASGSGVCRL